MLHRHTGLKLGCVSLAWAILAATAPDLASAADAPIDFARQIRPILSDKCFFCHGPDEKHREAELRLDLQTGLFRDVDGVTVVKPGKPEASELWRRVTAEADDERMPPAESGKKLSDAERSLIRRWIEQGANWAEHWSFKPLARPEVPATPEGRTEIGEID